MKSKTGKPFSKVYMQSPTDVKKGKLKESADLVLPTGTALRYEGEKALKEAQAYNEALDKGEYDSKYTAESIIPVGGMVLVRLYRMTEVNESGIHIPRMIKVPTPSGTGTKDIADPYPYTNVGRIVNMDPSIEGHYKFDVGDKVQLQKATTETVVIGGYPTMKGLFTRHDEDYYSGHVLVSPREITLILID